MQQCKQRVLARFPKRKMYPVRDAPYDKEPIFHLIIVYDAHVTVEAVSMTELLLSLSRIRYK